MSISSRKTTIFLQSIISYSLIFACLNGESKCRKGCDLALASYYVWEGSNLTYISNIFSRKIPEILSYNPRVPGPDKIVSGTRINVPFSCDCLNGDFLGHTFEYTAQWGDTYDKITRFAFANLTTAYWIQRVNVYDPTNLDDHYPINVTVNCSCGDRRVSRDYGLFATYALRPGESLESLANESGLPSYLLRQYNPGSDFEAGAGIVFLPAKGSWKI